MAAYQAAASRGYDTVGTVTCCWNYFETEAAPHTGRCPSWE